MIDQRYYVLQLCTSCYPITVHPLDSAMSDGVKCSTYWQQIKLLEMCKETPKKWDPNFENSRVKRPRFRTADCTWFLEQKKRDLSCILISGILVTILVTNAVFTRDTFTWGKCHFTIENVMQYNRNVNLPQVDQCVSCKHGIRLPRDLCGKLMWVPLPGTGAFGLGALRVIALKPALNCPKDIRKTLKQISEHFYCISVHVRDIP